MRKGFKNYRPNIYDAFLVFLLFLNIFPLLAPIFAHLGLTSSSHFVYTIYSFFCHQQHWKSIHVFDYQFAWCARDTFIWLAVLVTTIYVRIKKPSSIGWKRFILYMIPIGLDGGLQTIATFIGFSENSTFYVSTNLLRMITGGIFGIGLGFFLMPHLLEASGVEIYKSKRINQIKTGGIILLSLFVYYVLLIQIWQVTSIEYLPSNVLDSEVKIPMDNSDWFTRRENGI